MMSQHLYTETNIMVSHRTKSKQKHHGQPNCPIKLVHDIYCVLL